mmetsp:Transcript_1982/g.2853  ORF Transcript_1982/g.2853 Transcript_1982/m.2853 type:complete len:212 (-) Transcript_1982:101-736(-)
MSFSTSFSNFSRFFSAFFSSFSTVFSIFSSLVSCLTGAGGGGGGGVSFFKLNGLTVFTTGASGTTGVSISSGPANNAWSRNPPTETPRIARTVENLAESSSFRLKPPLVRLALAAASAASLSFSAFKNASRLALLFATKPFTADSAIPGPIIQGAAPRAIPIYLSESDKVLDNATEVTTSSRDAFTVSLELKPAGLADKGRKPWDCKNASV